jgi:hypothetical protein
MAVIEHVKSTSQIPTVCAIETTPVRAESASFSPPSPLLQTLTLSFEGTQMGDIYAAPIVALIILETSVV